MKSLRYASPMLARCARYLTAAALLCYGVSICGAQAQSTAQSLFGTQTPVLANAADGQPYELGMKFRVARSGQITAIRFWKSAADSGTHVGRIWSSTGALLGSATFSGETLSGWQQQALATPVAVQANATYVVSVNFQSNYPFTSNGLAASIVNGDISSVADGNNGVFGAPATFPAGSYQSSNYFRDIVFVAGTTGQATKLALSPVSANTQTGVSVGFTASIQDANGNTVTTATNPVTFSVSSVSGSFNPGWVVSPTAGVANASFTPSTSGSATITATSTGLASATASLAVAVSSVTQQSLFTTQTPAVSAASDGVPYEVGMKFQLARSGKITALRYWKSPGDTGTHVGRLWSATGTLLASTTFANETASGWQQQTLSSPISVQSGTTYVISVNIGNFYPITQNGLASAVINNDVSSVADGRNGVFGVPFAFPSNSFQSSNYFRDIVFVPDLFGAPAKLALAPASTNTQTNTPVTYTAAIQDASGNIVTSATNIVTFAATGLSGTFNPGPSVAAST